ncbi:hypothetical protein MY04_3911 [Flammeovirga sp. MY04]|uniref:hypothetical protein n=1 Tax=Flammeovirga sp. MY04 TaxID=1191459 RepID=UPI000825C0D6|nr:hypothetical protein [Flammeovirga sp. MY04]ANQ51255.2 hypothetical protein MY04_3911 [Flammeovirga sp. MY04]
MDYFMIAFIVMIMAYYFARIIIDKANKKLDPEKRAELFDIFSSGNKLTMITTVIIIGGFFLSLRFQVLDPLVTYIIYMLALFSFMIFKVINGHKKLQEFAYPKEYIYSFLFSSGIRFFGILFFCGLIMMDVLG